MKKSGCRPFAILSKSTITVDIDKDRRRSAVTDTVGRGNKRVAYRNDLVPCPDPCSQQRQMQRRRATCDGHGFGHATTIRDHAFKLGHPGPLANPAAFDGRFGGPGRSPDGVPGPALNYARWDGERWSTSMPLLSSGNVGAMQPSVALIEDELFMVSNGSRGEIAFPTFAAAMKIT